MRLPAQIWRTDINVQCARGGKRNRVETCGRWPHDKTAIIIIIIKKKKSPVQLNELTLCGSEGSQTRRRLPPVAAHLSGPARSAGSETTPNSSRRHRTLFVYPNFFFRKRLAKWVFPMKSRRKNEARRSRKSRSHRVPSCLDASGEEWSGSVRWLPDSSHYREASPPDSSSSLMFPVAFA